MTFRASRDRQAAASASRQPTLLGVSASGLVGLPRPALSRLRLRRRSLRRGTSGAALRLVGMASMWAAGLCLVVGSIAFVVRGTGPAGRPASGLATAAQHRATVATAPASTTPSPSTSAAGRSRIVATFSGRGNEATRRFRIRPHSRWQLRWCYMCPPSRRTGEFIVADAVPARTHAPLGPKIADSAPQGRGSTDFTAISGSNYLIVISSCSWSMDVAQDR